ncbi:hypothetical protein J1N35_025645 [Gossypium stocksii]|uniref:Uncharacterized protein n=1 Tax=Gossypium stocksii TaxID=47602 RepID=A0A9D3V6S0_9ROSI|nr:hypothetical protein J1N35_025645 [Gossypium stocksii]
MHDGTIKILLDVKHMPNLKRNLISLGILDSKSCKINIESNNIKVSRGAIVLMKGFGKTEQCVHGKHTRARRSAKEQGAVLRP